MVDTILSADNLTVLGGPEQIDVEFGVGSTGDRGSLFFTNLGNPNLLNIVSDFPTAPQSYDIYVDIDPSSTTYLQAFQYVLQDGVQVWIESFSLNNAPLSLNEVVTFTDGTAVINLNITKLGLDSSLFEELDNSFSFFNVQATASNSSAELMPSNTSLPIAFSISVDDAFFDSEGLTDPNDFPLKLPITIDAVEFNGTTWQDVTNKDIVMYFTVSYADPNTIISQLAGGAS